MPFLLCSASSHFPLGTLTPKKIHRICTHSFEHLSKAWPRVLLAQIPRVSTYGCAKEIPFLRLFWLESLQFPEWRAWSQWRTHCSGAGTTERNQAGARNLLHWHNPCRKRLNYAYPNFSPHRRDTVHWRLLTLCDRLGRARAGQECCVEQTQWAQGRKRSFRTWKEHVEEPFSFLKVFES